ncbi:hypothetical protein ASF49_03930 [Methylobacterium sp. Leaf104]|nr:hypothetical protein ASF49_03930 [Methylobacterium sp. Leaf104]
MIWLLAFSVVASLLGSLRYKAPAAIAGSAFVVVAGIGLGLAWWQLLVCVITLQLSYFAMALLINSAR